MLDAAAAASCGRAVCKAFKWWRNSGGAAAIAEKPMIAVEGGGGRVNLKWKTSNEGFEVNGVLL